MSFYIRVSLRIRYWKKSILRLVPIFNIENGSQNIIAWSILVMIYWSILVNYWFQILIMILINDFSQYWSWRSCGVPVEFRILWRSLEFLLTGLKYWLFSQPSVLKKNNPAIEKISSSILLKTCCDIVFSISGPQDYKFKWQLNDNK